MLLVLRVVGILDSSTMAGRFMQIIMISILVALGINRIRRYRVD